MSGEGALERWRRWPRAGALVFAASPRLAVTGDGGVVEVWDLP